MAERVNVADDAIDVVDDPKSGRAFYLRAGLYAPDDAIAIASRLLAVATAARKVEPDDVERSRPRTEARGDGVGVALLGDYGPEIVLGRESALALAHALAARLGIAWGLRGALLRLGGVVAEAAHASGALPEIVKSWRKAGGAGVFVSPSESTVVFTHPDATPDEVRETLDGARAWAAHELLRVISTSAPDDGPEAPADEETP